MVLEFTKYQGLGNDFILLDNRQQEMPLVTPEQAIRLCDRHFGIGGDGVIFALPGHDGSDYRMRIFNSDGSEPEMCGNGIRCLARFLDRLEGGNPIGKTYSIQTLAGIIRPRLEADEQVRVDMGEPQLVASDIPTTLADAKGQSINQTLEVAGQTWTVTCVGMGNPHCITFTEDIANIPLETIGPQFEYHEAFPERVNTEFIEVIRPDYIKMRVWERGAGSTLACGTGACASVVAGVLTNHCDRYCTVELPGGPLQIEWSAENNRIFMTGPAEIAFHGKIQL